MADKNKPETTQEKLEKQHEINEKKALGSNRKLVKDLKEKHQKEEDKLGYNQTIKWGHHKAGAVGNPQKQENQNQKERKDLSSNQLKEARTLHDDKLSSKAKFNKEAKDKK